MALSGARDCGGNDGENIRANKPCALIFVTKNQQYSKHRLNPKKGTKNEIYDEKKNASNGRKDES